ncbi:hypothetical protein HAHE_41940 [Haloferula helveola]|uniref:PA14 domain-containing protein n=1 Tax=Haloferula helveola TaxID=490095 RepID=A0ABN6H9H0_9BACT|nr:hypothetical protein HAHE_41940 [Haloferula helveola]
MLFLNAWLLAGLAGVGIPILIHLVRKQAAKPIDWGAMRFLFDTLVVRRRKMEWEDLLLMAARCLLLALVALAVARPFVPPDSSVPWMFVLPASLLGIALFGGSFVLSNAKWRWLIRGGAMLLLLAVAGMIWLEKQLNLKRFEASGRRDVALVIDASDSMTIADAGGRTIFERAVSEARDLVNEAPRGTAFTVVLGGPAPQAVTAAPLTHRADVLGVLEGLKPVGGTFRAHDALGMATVALNEGLNASKEIIVFTDDQRHGWRLDNPGSWDGLGEAWEGMTAKPKLLLRSFGEPELYRNVALGNFELSRTVVGTDREVGIFVTVTNAGEEPVTPGPVELEIEGKIAGEQPVGLLVPGQSETVGFRHKFAKAGPAIIRARIAAKDDLGADDRLERVVAVRERLPVLIVDGNPTGGFFERASGYTALALAPGQALAGGSGGKYLMDPEVISAASLRADDLEGRDVVVLADVARLPKPVAERLATEVANGAGLVTIAGPRAEGAFYNTWRGAAGPVMPMPVGEESVEVDGLRLAPSTYVHEALEMFKESGDLDEALVRRWRKLGDPVDGAAQGAAFANGDAFLGSRVYGKGRSLMVSCAFDARAGNLPAKRAFVPLVHELVTWAAGGGISLNLKSNWSPSVVVGQGGGGLSARYFRRRGDKAVLERIDPGIDFRWMNEKAGKQLPLDDFRVEWEATLVPPVSGTYVFAVEVDDEFGLKIGDGPRMRAGVGKNELGRVTLEAGVPVEFKADYREDSGEAYVRLFWTPPGKAEQIVPANVFVPVRDATGEILKVIDPEGLAREAKVSAGRRGEELAIGGPAVPGIYEVEVGDIGATWLNGWKGGTLPVAVVRDEVESRFESMDKDDLEVMRSKLVVVEPRSVDDMLGVLQGKGFGREIWKVVAIAAFVLFLLESMLSRWVSKSRRMAEDVRVEFGDQPAWEGGRR